MVAKERYKDVLFDRRGIRNITRNVYFIDGVKGALQGMCIFLWSLRGVTMICYLIGGGKGTVQGVVYFIGGA